MKILSHRLILGLVVFQLSLVGLPEAHAASGLDQMRTKAVQSMINGIQQMAPFNLKAVVSPAGYLEEISFIDPTSNRTERLKFEYQNGRMANVETSTGARINVQVESELARQTLAQVTSNPGGANEIFQRNVQFAYESILAKHFRATQEKISDPIQSSDPELILWANCASYFAALVMVSGLFGGVEFIAFFLTGPTGGISAAVGLLGGALVGWYVLWPMTVETWKICSELFRS